MVYVPDLRFVVRALEGDVGSVGVGRRAFEGSAGIGVPDVVSAAVVANGNESLRGQSRENGEEEEKR